MNKKAEMQYENAASMGLSEEEWLSVCSHLGRIPNLCELGIFSAMWSEHCSYKSSKKWLKTLPTEGECVIQGPGENAGVIDIGDGLAVVFKIESHNHPSFIEPYQGAATGVGGILRDVFTMGARPIALLNALRFGQIDHKKTSHLISGVTSGIGGYGNCIGIPTVGGEVEFDSSYNGNILVNAMAVGLAHNDRIFYSAASGAGNPVIYVGAKTGRDGIHGATMASAEFNNEAELKRPTVQVGDPFKGKLLMEACLELMAADAVIAIQDMGAAGLTSSSVEMAAKGGLGMEIDLDLVPVRETNMTAYEIMLSESQERMLMVIDPNQAEIAQQIFNKWDLDFMPIGKVTETDRLVLLKEGKIACDIPVAPLVDNAPEYDRPHLSSEIQIATNINDIVQKIPITEALKKLVGSEDLCSRRWIYEQYDSQVMADTIIGPGGDAALVRVYGTKKAIALTTDCTTRYVEANPYSGGKQAVAEAYRNIIAVGATPLAVTNNLNFGNPEKPEIMAQLIESVAGIKDACIQLSTPVVSGNVSLYNETEGRAIKPCPVIGMVGVMDDWEKSGTIALPSDNDIVIIGQNEKNNSGWLSNSTYAKFISKKLGGAPPPVDLNSELKAGKFILDCYHNDLINAAHDISDGGMLVALTEMMLAGNNGAEIIHPKEADPHCWFFGENQSSYIIATTKLKEIIKRSENANIPLSYLGRSSSVQELKISNGDIISLKELQYIYETGLTKQLLQ